MKASRTKINTLARKLADASIVDGEPVQERVDAVLKLLRTYPLGQRRALLGAYLRMMRREEATRTLQIEHAGKLDPTASAELVTRLTQRTGRKLIVRDVDNPQLIAGLRVRLGDDIYDTSIAGALERLGKNKNF